MGPQARLWRSAQCACWAAGASTDLRPPPEFRQATPSILNACGFARGILAADDEPDERLEIQATLRVECSAAGKWHAFLSDWPPVFAAPFHQLGRSVSHDVSEIAAMNARCGRFTRRGCA